jgi:glycosyltransferase involved in cell wall biosynthesis
MISFAITTYNRYQMTIDCFAQIIDNDFISEFVIVDDASTDNSGELLKEYFKDSHKVKIFLNKENLGMSRNKELAIRLCKEDFILIADSDNVFGNDYINSLNGFGLSSFSNHFLMPSFAKSNFDYRTFSDNIIGVQNIRKFMDEPMFEQLLNTCNMIVNRKNYLEVYEYNPTVKEVDTLWMNYLWLKSGKFFYVVPNMEYIHNVHSGSGWLSNAKENIQKAEEIKSLILAL